MMLGQNYDSQVKDRSKYRWINLKAGENELS